jgi:DNA-binding transcriptional ArsR family regulator
VVNLDELRWFLDLADTEHVTDAAAALGISQPTLSRALARLEDQVGAELFDRVNRRLVLNAYGRIMADHARRATAELDAAVERIAALRDPDTGTVRLAFLHSVSSWYVPELLRRFRAGAPHMRFDLYQGPAPRPVRTPADRTRRPCHHLTAPRVVPGSAGTPSTSSSCAWPCPTTTPLPTGARCASPMSRPSPWWPCPRASDCGN